MRRSQPALFLPHSPLVVVLAQFRFSPVVAMESYVPQIQDQVRRKGFPNFRAEDIEEVTWNVVPGAPPTADTRKFTRWEFADRGQHWLMVLTQETLAVATSAYLTYEKFAERLAVCLEAVGEHAEPETITQMGLRYVDLIHPEPGLEFSDYLTDRLLGLEPASVGMLDSLAYSQLRGKTDIGAMMVRCVFLADGQILPPDLRGMRLTLNKQLQVGQKYSILDLDHFRTLECEFRRDEALDRLGELHDALDQAFRSAVTTSAIERWSEPRVDSSSQEKKRE